MKRTSLLVSLVVAALCCGATCGKLEPGSAWPPACKPGDHWEGKTNPDGTHTGGCVPDAKPSPAALTVSL